MKNEHRDKTAGLYQESPAPGNPEYILMRIGRVRQRVR